LLELETRSVPPSTDPRIVRVRSLEEAFQKAPIRCVILPYTLQMIDDIQFFLASLHALMRPETRLIILQYNFFWAPVLKGAQKLGLRAALPDLNWLNVPDLRNLLVLTSYQEITSGARCLIPFKVPLLSDLVNHGLAPLPIFQWVCQKQYVIARALKNNSALKEAAVSVVV